MWYTVELDGINGCGTNFYEPRNHVELINWVQEDLKALGGGHADIYNEDGNFVEDAAQVAAFIKAGSKANSQKVICLTTGEIFSSQSEAARQTGIPQANISKVLRGERKSAGKHPVTGEKMLWRVYEEVDIN